MMNKLPQIEKMYEAYSTIVDNRITMREQEAGVSSPSQIKAYFITWQRDAGGH